MRIKLTLLLAGSLLISFYANAEDLNKQKRDVPTLSQQQRNALKRIAQLTEIKWQPVLPNTMPSRKGYFPGGHETGVPYSSARGVGRWIGYDISLETFMTAVQNPESVLYTEDLRKEPYKVSNGATYYGLTCSSFVQYAFRDDFYWGTLLVHENPERANMKLLEEQSADGIEVCDILNTAGKGHMEIITDITYTESKVASIELTEIVYTGPRRKRLTPSEFNKYIKDKVYLLYRYNMPDSIPYSPSGYVTVGNEEPGEITFNKSLALDRGNKTNYVKNTPVKFNIMNSDAVSLVIKKDNGSTEAVDITHPGVMEKVYSDCGRYSAHCVMQDKSVSDLVEFIVSDVSIDAPDKVKAGSDINIKFSSERCVPRYIMLQETGTYSPQLSRTLTEQEIKRGSVTISYGDTGSFLIVISGLNEFGGVYSNRGLINIVN